jgi:thiol-disulfide isomerase/thioredoxin
MNKKKLALLFAGGIALFLLLVLGVRDIQWFEKGPDEAADVEGGAIRTIRFVKNPEPSPEISIQDLDGRALNSSDWLGRVVLLNFWATWCPPCRAEIPELIRLQEEYGDQLLVVGLSIDQDTPEAVRQFATEYQINYPVAMASEELQERFGGIFGLPTTFVLDTLGRVVQKHIGLPDPALYELEVRALLGAPVAARIDTFEDTGQVLLANVQNATELPSVDFIGLSANQKKAALRRMNEEQCTCGCEFTIAQCRIHDSSCGVSIDMAKQVVANVAGN